MPEPTYPGENINLPQTGPGSLATIGRRVMALVVDTLIAAALTWPFTVPELPRNWSVLTFAVIYTLSTAFMGRTPGMAMMKIRLASDVPDRQLGLIKALIRVVLLFLVIPAVLMDENRRGFHDKAAGTVVVSDI